MGLAQHPVYTYLLFALLRANPEPTGEIIPPLLSRLPLSGLDTKYCTHPSLAWIQPLHNWKMEEIYPSAGVAPLQSVFVDLS